MKHSPPPRLPAIAHWIAASLVTALNCSSYLQGFQKPERAKPAATGNQTESGIVQHFTVIIPNKNRGEKRKFN